MTVFVLRNIHLSASEKLTTPLNSGWSMKIKSGKKLSLTCKLLNMNPVMLKTEEELTKLMVYIHGYTVFLWIIFTFVSGCIVTLGFGLIAE